MSVKKVDIEIPKLDYQIISIGILDGNGQLTELGQDDEMYMTVGLENNTETYKIQKSLSNGIAYNSSTHKYDITIDSEDTAELEMGVNYGYDITIYYGGDKPKQKVIGEFKISKKFTLVEVS